MTPFGLNRSQTTKVPEFDKNSNSFLSRQFKPNSQAIGSNLIDRHRPVVQMVNVRFLEPLKMQLFNLGSRA